MSYGIIRDRQCSCGNRFQVRGRKRGWLRPYDLARGYPQSPAGRWMLSEVGRTGPSSEGRPRSVLRFGYVRAAFVLDAGFTFARVVFAFVRVFSFSALTTALRNAFVSTL
jgi:hypothetical protein